VPHTPKYTIPTGPHAGTVLMPWRDAEGYYVASRSNLVRKYVRTQDFQMWCWLLKQGLRGRFSAPGIGSYLVHPNDDW
jgi:hypothetical protein